MKCWCGREAVHFIKVRFLSRFSNDFKFYATCDEHEDGGFDNYMLTGDAWRLTGEEFVTSQVHES